MSAASTVLKHLIISDQSFPFLEQPTMSPSLAALVGATLSCAGWAHGSKFVPDCDIPLWNNPFDNGDIIWYVTLAPPALSPKIVTYRRDTGKHRTLDQLFMTRRFVIILCSYLHRMLQYFPESIAKPSSDLWDHCFLDNPLDRYSRIPKVLHTKNNWYRCMWRHSDYSDQKPVEFICQNDILNVKQK